MGTGSIGPVGAAQRLFNTALINERTAGPVPAGARTATVKIVLQRVGDGYNHAYADAVALVLKE